MSDYLDNVLKASGGSAAPEEVLEDEIPEGYHRMPDGTIMKDSAHENEAALEKDSDDPCWEGYVQLGTKMKNGKEVPNCVPKDAALAAALEKGSDDPCYEGYVQLGTKMKNGKEVPNCVPMDASVTAALEKDSDDPCWEGYVQLGMKKLRGQMVPNCVPIGAAQNLELFQSAMSSDELEEVLTLYNGAVGGYRRVALTAAAEVVARSYVQYQDAYSGEELSEAVLWELHSYLEYATLGMEDDIDVVASHNDLLNEGHPALALTASLQARINWAASAPELEESAREAVKTALSSEADAIEALHATSRVKALVSSGVLSAHTAALVNSLMSN